MLFHFDKKIKKRFSPLLFLSAFVLFSACSPQGQDDKPPNQLGTDSSPPIIIDSNPQDQALAVAANVILSIKFNEAINSDTISETSVLLHEGGNSVSGVVSYDKNAHEIFFTPNQPLNTDSKYTLIATTALTDIAGNALETEKRVNFSTIDTISPTIVNTSPSDQSPSVSTAGALYFEFSEPLDSNTANNTNIVLTSNSVAVSGSVNYDDTTYRIFFVPDSGLQNNVIYEFTATTGVTDIAGNSLAVEKKISFTTEASIVRLSVNPDGSEANHNSGVPRLSIDGRYVVYTSQASNLGSTARTGVVKIYVNDVNTGINTLASVTLDGSTLTGASYLPSISADGRFVAFESGDSLLVEGDTNLVRDIFVRDMQDGITHRASVSSAGIEGSGESRHAFISADGRYVTFESTSNTLTADDANSFSDVFIHDLQSHVTERVSFGNNGASPNNNSSNPSINSNGRYIAYESLATNITEGDTVSNNEIYLYDRQTNVTTPVSVSFDGSPVTGTSAHPYISGDGRFIAFESTANNLVENVTLQHGYGIFVRDMQMGVTHFVSVSTGGDFANGFATNSSISNDGRFVLFYSIASNLVSDDNNNALDIFLHDRQTGITVRPYTGFDGNEANGPSGQFSGFSGDGRYIGFASQAANLDANKINVSTYDVYRVVNPLY